MTVVFNCLDDELTKSSLTSSARWTPSPVEKRIGLFAFVEKGIGLFACSVKNYILILYEGVIITLLLFKALSLIKISKAIISLCSAWLAK